MPGAILLYLVLCGVIAYMGRHYRLRFWGYFFLSLFLSPVIGIIALIAATPVKSSDKCEECCEELAREQKRR